MLGRLNALETVAGETPVSSATWLMVGAEPAALFMGSHYSYSGRLVTHGLTKRQSEDGGDLMQSVARTCGSLYKPRARRARLRKLTRAVAKTNPRRRV